MAKPPPPRCCTTYWSKAAWTPAAPETSAPVSPVRVADSPSSGHRATTQCGWLRPPASNWKTRPHSAPTSPSCSTSHRTTWTGTATKPPMATPNGTSHPGKPLKTTSSSSPTIRGSQQLRKTKHHTTAAQVHAVHNAHRPTAETAPKTIGGTHPRFKQRFTFLNPNLIHHEHPGTRPARQTQPLQLHGRRRRRAPILDLNDADLRAGLHALPQRGAPLGARRPSSTTSASSTTARPPMSTPPGTPSTA